MKSFIVRLSVFFSIIASQFTFPAITDPDVQTALKDLRENFYCYPTGQNILMDFMSSRNFDKIYVIDDGWDNNPCLGEIWGTGDVMCSHPGITCVNNNVVGLDLPCLVLIPDSIGNLVNLELLRVEGKYITGGIPDSIVNLTQLRELRLGIADGMFAMYKSLTNWIYSFQYGTYFLEGDASLTGSIPNGMESMQNLEILDLSGNYLSGALPTSIGALSSLRVLDLGGNNFSGNIPVELANLASLEVLDLGRLADIDSSGSNSAYIIDNNFDGIFPVELSYLSTLTRLDLSHNQITGELPIDVLYLTNLSDNNGINVKGNSLYSNNELLIQFVEFEKGSDYSPQLIYSNPVANAGSDLNVFENSTIEVFGSSILPPSVTATYQWQQVSGVALTLTNANTSTVSFESPLVTGSESVTLELKVTDSFGRTDTDQVNINISEYIPPPVADAGIDLVVFEETGFVLDASASITPTGSSVLYLWEQVAGPNVTIDDPDSDTINITAPSVSTKTELKFRLTLTSQFNQVSSDEVTILVKNDADPPNDPASDDKWLGRISFFNLFFICVVFLFRSIYLKIR